MFHAVAAALVAIPLGGVDQYFTTPLPLPQAGEVSAAAAGRSYGGHTSDNEPIAIRVRGRQVTEAVLELHTACDSKQIFPVATDVVHDPGKANVPEMKGGRLSRKGRFKSTSAAVADFGDTQAVVNISLEGKLGARKSSGALAMDVTFTDKASGQVTDHCTDARRWTARVPERRVYSGATKQTAPAVLELNAKRTRVKEFWFGIFADCMPEGVYAPTFGLQNFRIRHGRFGDDYSHQIADGAGGTIQLDFAFHGRMSRSGARGTIKVTATDRDAQGNAGITCTSDTVGWTVTQ